MGESDDATRMGIILTSGASMIWGTTFVATGIGLVYTNAYNLVFLRFLTASAIILGLCGLGRARGIDVQLRKTSVWLLGGVYALGFLLQYVGQSLASASDASLLANLAPTLVPPVALLVLRESVRAPQKLATVIGFGGLVIIASPKLGVGSGELTGDILLFGTSVSYAVFIVLSKRAGVGSMVSSFAIIVSITLFLFPVALIMGNLYGSFLTIAPLAWLSALYMGALASVLAIALYLRGLKSVRASLSATLLLVQLLVGLTLSVLILRDPIGYAEVVGAVLISGAVVLASLAK